jgi:hypothetical protein
MMDLHEIENLMHLNKPNDKARMIQTLLMGQTMYYFEHYFRRRLEAEDSEIPNN